jgi:hypothetical protein
MNIPVAVLIVFSLLQIIQSTGSGWWRPTSVQTTGPTSTIPVAVPATAAEPCDTLTTQPDAIVLSPDLPWTEPLTDPADPHRIFLLRGGLYRTSDKLWLKAGAPTAPLLIKPYNCEPVILHSSIRPASHTVLAGLTIEATGIEDIKWAIRLDGKNEEPIRNVTLRHNIIRGGTIDALRISGDVQTVELAGNDIDGGESGHDIFITAEGTAVLPAGITITRNLLTKAHFTSAAEDMIQIRDTGALTITENICTAGHNMEQCIDIKNTTAPLLIARNLFDGDNLHRAGTGADQAGGCMVIHEDDGHGEQHRIEYNEFRHCKGTIIRFATGSRAETSSAQVRYNLFLQAEEQASVMPVEIATDLHLLNNTFVGGTLKLGNSAQTRFPRGLRLQNNIFYQTAIEDHTPVTAPYDCTHNLLYQVDGAGFITAPCTQTTTADPQFIDSAHGNFYLLPSSPALNGGANGSTIGALPAIFPPTGLTHHLFLPLLRQETRR